MKKTLVISAIMIGLLGVSCTNKEEQRLREQHLKDSFNTLLNEKISESQTLEAQMKDIDNNLMRITSKYTELRQIVSSDEVINESLANHITAQINAIADLLEKDRNRIASIQSQLKKQKQDATNVSELQEKINNLNDRIKEGENKIASLTEELKDKNVELTNLNSQVTKLQEENKKAKADLSKLEDERYSAYFVVGTKKELKALGLIDTKGGFIGIGKTTTLATNGDISTMKKIDIRNVNEIPLTGQRVEVLTSHPSNSYSLQGPQNKPSSLLITSSEEFWQASRCLVILVK